MLIRIKEGPREIRVAIECRRRKHKSDVRWVEELVGKRNNLGIDHMVAVSASPFTPEAKDCAAIYHIELMELSEFYDTDWTPWLECSQLVQIERGLGEGNVQLFGDHGQPITLPDTDANAPLFRNEKGEMLSFITVWNNNSQPFYAQLVPNAPPETRRITINVPDTCALYVQQDGEWQRVSTMLLDAQVWVRHNLVPLRPALTYRDVLAGQVVLGYTETAVPIIGPDGKKNYLGFAKVPAEDSPPGGGRIVVVMRPAE